MLNKFLEIKNPEFVDPDKLSDPYFTDMFKEFLVGLHNYRKQGYKLTFKSCTLVEFIDDSGVLNKGVILNKVKHVDKDSRCLVNGKFISSPQGPIVMFFDAAYVDNFQDFYLSNIYLYKERGVRLKPSDFYSVGRWYSGGVNFDYLTGTVNVSPTFDNGYQTVSVNKNGMNFKFMPRKRNTYESIVHGKNFLAITYTVKL